MRNEERKRREWGVGMEMGYYKKRVRNQLRTQLS
jgi:hypothetical protein